MRSRHPQRNRGGSAVRWVIICRRCCCCPTGWVLLLLLTWGNFLYRHVRSTPPLLIAQQSLRAMETAERRLHIDGLERALWKELLSENDGP